MPDIFIKFEPTTSGFKVEGDSQDAYFKTLPGGAGTGVIELQDFSLGMENPTTFSVVAGGAGAGKAVFRTLTFKKLVDPSSIGLLRVLTTGAHFPKATLWIRQPASTIPYLVYTFGTVFATKIDVSGSGDGRPTEAVELTFGGMEVSYFKTDPGGKLSTVPIKAGWSMVTNTERVEYK